MDVVAIQVFSAWDRFSAYAFPSEEHSQRNSSQTKLKITRVFLSENYGPSKPEACLQVVTALPFSISPEDKMYPAPAKMSPNPNLRAYGGSDGFENPTGDVPRTGRLNLVKEVQAEDAKKHTKS